MTSISMRANPSFSQRVSRVLVTVIAMYAVICFGYRAFLIPRIERLPGGGSMTLDMENEYRSYGWPLTYKLELRVIYIPKMGSISVSPTPFPWFYWKGFFVDFVVVPALFLIGIWATFYRQSRVSLAVGLVVLMITPLIISIACTIPNSLGDGVLAVGLVMILTECVLGATILFDECRGRLLTPEKKKKRV